MCPVLKSQQGNLRSVKDTKGTVKHSCTLLDKKEFLFNEQNKYS